MTAANGDLLDFGGRVVLITGAATGIGRAVAIGFASHGARVAVGDINEEAPRETLDLATRAFFFFFFSTVERFGRLDCAFNNAGIVHAPQPMAQLDASVFDRVIAVDLRGVFLCMKYELRHMLRAGRGTIVNTASVAGLLPEANDGAYVAAKHGVIGLTKTRPSRTRILASASTRWRRAGFGRR